MTGNLDEAARDAGLVALAFVRAHAPWLSDRYGLIRDPRVRTDADWSLALDHADRVAEGGSLGCALAGKREWDHTSLPHCATHGHSLHHLLIKGSTYPSFGMEPGEWPPKHTIT